MARVSQNPLLLSSDAEQLFLHSMNELAQHEDFAKASAVSGASSDDDQEFWSPDSWTAGYRPYNVVNGVLQIPVSGVLLNRFGYHFGRYATGYQYIERAYNRGMDDPEVNGIALIVDSPGGEVAGNFELVDKMFERRGEKPVRAFASDHAYSAAYSIASAADMIVMSRSGGVGSIGVVTAHVEYSEAMKEQGVKVTFIYAGKHKVDGNPYEKLPEATKARMQARIDRIYGEFTGLVARNRGMEESAVRETEALTYDASEALAVGLADKVGALDEEMVIFSQETEPRNDLMAIDKNTPAAGNEGGQITQAQMDASIATARTEASVQGAAAERTRINAIMGSDEGKARPKASMSAALKTNMTAEEAVAFLGDLPAESAEAPKTETPQAVAPTGTVTNFAQAMSVGNPNVGASAPAGEQPGEQAPNEANAILSALSMATGKKRPAA
jgi:signal peptide peptidase SppA